MRYADVNLALKGTTDRTRQPIQPLHGPHCTVAFHVEKYISENHYNQRSNFTKTIPRKEHSKYSFSSFHHRRTNREHNWAKRAREATFPIAFSRHLNIFNFFSASLGWVFSCGFCFEIIYARPIPSFLYSWFVLTGTKRMRFIYSAVFTIVSAAQSVALRYGAVRCSV